MTTPIDTAALIARERQWLEARTKKGAGLPIAGLLYWISVSMLLRGMPVRGAMLWSFVLTGAVFPIGLALTAWFGGRLFEKHAFSSLGGVLAATQLAYWPVIILVWIRIPEWTPFTMAVLFGSHFLPYAWLYRSRAYAVLAISTVLVTTVAVMVARQPLMTTIPLIAAGCYAVSTVLLMRELRTLSVPA